MGIFLRLLFIGVALVFAGEPDGQPTLSDLLLANLKNNPGEANFESDIPQIAALPAGPRLELAQKLSAARPNSIALQFALADAYSVNEQPQKTLSILDAVLRDHPEDHDLPTRVAADMSRLGLDEEAAALMDREVEISSDPVQYLPWQELMIQYSQNLLNGGPAARLKQNCARSVASGKKDLKSWLLLAQDLSLSRDMPALQRLCESALAMFPQERRFYDYLSSVLASNEDWPALITLKRGEIAGLPILLSSDYVDLAHALLREGKLEKARRTLAQGLKDARLSKEEKQKLEERIAALDMLWGAILANRPSLPNSCVYKDAGRTVSVNCDGKRLTYDFSTKSFLTKEKPAEAARLAGILLKRFDEARLAEVKNKKTILSKETKVWLKAAGYLGP